LEILQALGGFHWSPDVGLRMPPSAPSKPWLGRWTRPRCDMTLSRQL